MEHAAAEFGSDYMKIVRNYNGAHFGFAVKNYYAEFLAADQVHRYENKYFPGIEAKRRHHRCPHRPSCIPSFGCGGSCTAFALTTIAAT